ncbi:SET domain-containing protein [Aspergillus steynii IBT 23096]|uniref:SET domain-containing protein n=1 Tax=Aspergillus steynii IBT 23096 TaxID=1392250 RepID=A0A2I2FYY7_9EURO|nr:SET domain-containing protein [Aspergillus steynii IBT 23096]PLB45850.1 SET domain-containing protein [Aspergillus steynii IBT 23096]
MPRVKRPKIYLNLRIEKPKIKLSRRASDIVAAIYWDINNLCFLQGVMWQNNDMRYLPYYQSQCDEARNLVRMAVDYKMNALSPAEKQVREVRNIARFVHNVGWRVLAICAYTEAFRRACLLEMDRDLWKKLIALTQDNSESLVFFARTRNLDWRGLLLRYSNHPINELTQHLTWFNNKRIGREHPHHFVRTMGGVLRRPTYQGRLQENIEECIFDPEGWIRDGQYMEDPSVREEEHGDCKICGSSERCKCSPGSLVAGLVELVEYPGKGVGVRALANFKKGELLAEYVGDIVRAECGDDTYGLYLQDIPSEKVTASISSQLKGNWTRFINHSCNPSTEFATRTIGNRLRMTVEALRDISIFEEITIHYGEGYWLNADRDCVCGEVDCVSVKKARKAARAAKARERAEKARTEKAEKAKAKEEKAKKRKEAKEAKEAKNAKNAKHAKNAKDAKEARGGMRAKPKGDNGRQANGNPVRRSARNQTRERTYYGRYR